MKNKIVFSILLAVMLTILVAISISATATVSPDNLDENGEIVADYLGEYTIDGSTQSISSIDVTYLSTDGETKTGKVYYVTNIWNSYRQMNSTYLPSDYDMNQMVYGMFDKMDVNGDGTYARTDKVTGTQGDKNLYYKYGSYSDGVFTDLVDVKMELKRLTYSRYLEYFGPNAYAKVPVETITHSGREPVDGTFFVAPSVKEFYGGNNGSSFGGSANGNINGSTCQFTRLVFEERTGSVSFAQYCLCRNVIEEVVFLGGTYGLRSDAIAYLWGNGTNTPCLERVVVAEGVVFSSGSISLNVGTYDIVYIGDEEGYATQAADGGFDTALTCATGNIIYEELCYVYGHTEEENDYDCTTALACLYAEDGCDYEFAPATEHNNGTTITYENGYMQAGKKVVGCTNDGCNHAEETTELDPIFTSKGYSKDTTSNAIVLEIIVNNDAIDAYESYLKSINAETTLAYGIVVAIADNDEDTSNDVLFDENGEVKAGAIAMKAEKNNFSNIKTKITGIGEGNYDTALHCSGYINVNGVVTYVNGAGTADYAEKVTYNSIPNEE